MEAMENPANSRAERYPLQHFFAFLALAGLALLMGCSAVDRTVPQASLPCGIYRWPLKTLTDHGAKRIRWQPIDATLRHLVELPRPERIDEDHRTADEFRVYRIRAILVEVRPTTDQDLHLLLRDPVDPALRMIAEVPDPECAKGSGHEADFAAVRKRAASIHADGGEPLVEIMGVGFFDIPDHGIDQHAPNGFELHPVLSIREISAKGR